MVWTIAAAILGISLFLLLRALVVGGRMATPVIDADVAFYKAQLEEIARQAASGMIGAAEAEAAEAEAARRLLAASHDGASRTTSVSRRALRIVSIILLVAVPAVSLAVYARLGSPGRPGVPLAGRSLPDPAELQLAGFIAQIEERLAANPEDARGLELIAPLYLRAGRPEDAANALTRLIAVAGSTPERQADLGEAIAAAHDGQVTPEARAAFERAVAEKPSLQKAQFYLGRAYAQSGDAPRARAIFTALLSTVPPSGPLHALINGEIEGLKSIKETAP